MKKYPKINKISVVIFEWESLNLGTDYNTFNQVYDPGSKKKQKAAILQVHTDQGIVGEYPMNAGVDVAEIQSVSNYLIGKNPLSREEIYKDIKRGMRQSLNAANSYVDICLWDIAGKIYQEPIYRLLGGEKIPLKAYASTLHGDENGGLGTPQDFSDFAQECLELGYKAFKVHGWGLARNDIDREIKNVLLLGKNFENKLDLLIDPACEIKNFGDALRIGRACDEAKFFWLEDPYADGGVSQFAHRKLRQMIDTPILQTEHIRFLEQHVDFILSESTDYVRAGAYQDGGITGTMKIAHATEGFGLDVELHGPGPVHRHIMSSIKNTNFYELGLVHPKLSKFNVWSKVYKDYSDELDAVDKNGNVFAPDGYGIGVELDWDWINNHTVDKFNLAG